MEAYEVDAWQGYQYSQFGHEVYGLEDHMGCAIAVRGFEFIPNVSNGGQCKALF